MTRHSNAAIAGYSGTPLAKKLGIKPGASLFAHGAPADYAALLAPLPDGVVRKKALSADVDVVHVFTTSKSALAAFLAAAVPKLRADAALWVSWPKKASKVVTDITEDTVRQLAFPLGLVDVKVCAVDEVWSGLKLVLRKELRPHRT